MSDSYFIRLGLNVRGPYSTSDLHELAARGGFSKSHEVSKDKKSWESAAKRPDLFPAARKLNSPGKSNREAHDGSIELDEIQQVPTNNPDTRVRNILSGEPSEGLQPGSSTMALGSPRLSPLSIWTAVTGPFGFVMLLISTVLVVLSLRSSSFVATRDILMIILLVCTFLTGGIAVTLGHLSIPAFHRRSGSLKERNLIVLGLSCGYTMLILCTLYTVVLVINSFQ